MIRIDVSHRLVRTANQLGPEITAKAEEQLGLLARQFGSPHLHSGLGLRKLGRRSYEIRVWRQWRIVLIQEPDRLTAYDLLNHDEVATWLKGRRGQ